MKDEDQLNLKAIFKELKRRFIGNAMNPLTVNLIWLCLVLIAFFSGMLIGAIHYSNVANEYMQEVLNELAEDRFLTYENTPERVQEIFKKYKVSLNGTERLID
jgi:hypothetical protein